MHGPLALQQLVGEVRGCVVNRRSVNKVRKDIFRGQHLSSKFAGRGELLFVLWVENLEVDIAD